MLIIIGTRAVDGSELPQKLSSTIYLLWHSSLPIFQLIFFLFPKTLPCFSCFKIHKDKFFYELELAPCSTPNLEDHPYIIGFGLIKNMLTRRKETDTYLATVSRHRWSRQITIKIDNTVAFIN